VRVAIHKWKRFTARNPGNNKQGDNMSDYSKQNHLLKIELIQLALDEAYELLINDETIMAEKTVQEAMNRTEDLFIAIAEPTLEWDFSDSDTDDAWIPA